MSSAGRLYHSELRLSPRGVLLILLCIDSFFFFGMQWFSKSFIILDQTYTYYLVIGIFVLIGIGLDFWKTILARWFTSLGLIFLLFFFSRWLHSPEVLVMLSVPVLLLAAMVDFLPAAGVGALLSLLFIFARQIPIFHLDISLFFIFLCALWPTLGVFYALVARYDQINHLLSDDYVKTRERLRENNDQTVRLEQTREGLANANRQLAQANRRMAMLSAIAEDAQKAKSTFVANVSHEFRTPLNMIIGLIDLMTRNPENYDVILSPKMREDFSVIARNCEHLSNMINDVLDLTRIETGRLALLRESVDLPEVIQKAVTVVQPLLTKKKLFINIDIPHDLPLIYCDRTRIQQVILNLLSNAARFTETGGIHIRITLENQIVTTSVADTGPGISPEDGDRIFEPFWQGKDQVWQKKGGSGLGLTLSKEFVNLHGGQMWFESKHGRGTTFYFTLPTSLNLDPAVRPGHLIKEDWVWREEAFKSGQEGATNHIIKPRILLLDNTGTLDTRFSHYADRVEFNAVQNPDQVTTETAAQALVFNSPTIDQLWPSVETLVRNTSALPVIGVSVPGEFKRAIDLGAKGYFIKPVKMEDLKSVLASAEPPVQDVLVVDDDPDILSLYSRMILACNPSIRVRTAPNGASGLEEIRHNPPSLVLLDVVMPEVNGWQVLSEMRREGLEKKTATYFVTAQDPADQLVSSYLVASIKGGISLNQILRCSLGISALLTEPEQEPGPALEQNLLPGPALR